MSTPKTLLPSLLARLPFIVLGKSTSPRARAHRPLCRRTLATAALSMGVAFIAVEWHANASFSQESQSRTPSSKEQTVKAELEPGFEWLFDGKTLDGWEGNTEWFRIEEGAIVAGSLKSKVPHNEFLCTKKNYEDFELRLEVKLRGEGDNAGVQFRTSRIPNNTEVSGYQCDVGRAWNRNVWGLLYDESRRNKLLADLPDDKLKPWVKEGDWNMLAIKCVGNKIELSLNGHPTVTYLEEDSKIARSGVIGLQIHSGPPTEALYRNIRIQLLPTK